MIGTAWLRIDLLPADRQPAIREDFRKYTDSRIELYRFVAETGDLAEIERGAAAIGARTAELQQRIWEASVQASKESGWVPAATLLLPALNDMIDITTTRTMSTKLHPPYIIFVMLFGFILASAVLVGYGTAKSTSRPLFHMLIFVLLLSATFFVIIDLEYPRLGLIRLDSFDEAIVQVRAQMN